MSENPKRKVKHGSKRKIIVGFVVFFTLILSAVFVGVFWGASKLSDMQHEAFGMEAKFTISYFLGTELPDNASDFHVYHSQWQDIFADIRFTAPPEELELWLTNSTFCPTLEENISSTSIPTNYFDVDWWQANEALNYTLYNTCGKNPTYLIFIDQTDMSLWVVYIQYTQS